MTSARIVLSLLMAVAVMTLLPARRAAADDGELQLKMNGWMPVPIAKVDVLLYADPNMTVPAGSILTYQVVVNNRGEAGADMTRLTFPLDGTQVQLLDVVTTRSGFWVDSVVSNQFTMQTGTLTPYDVVTATVRVRTLPSLANGTEIRQVVNFDAPDNDPSAPTKSNQTLVTIGSLAQQQALIPLNVAPWLAPVGRILEFSSMAFQPGEMVTFWYSDTTPRETFVETIRTGDDGMLLLRFDSGVLRPGYYTMLAHGQHSGLTGRVAFQMEPNLGTTEVTVNPDGSVTWRETTFGTGDIQATLIWNRSVDLNLVAIEPGGATVAAAGNSSSSARVESGPNCRTLIVGQPEHIVWPSGTAAAGVYQFYVEYADGCIDDEDTPFTLRVLTDGAERLIGGMIGPGDARQLVLSLTKR